MLLRIENLWVRYGGIIALSGVSIDVPEGETVLLVGANGAGKSSTINAIIGLVPAAQGRIVFDGNDLGRVPCERRARMGIGYSPEGRRVFPTMSVTDNVLAGAFGLGRARQTQALDWLRSVFPLLVERADQPAGQLSGGQQQIVALSRAMASFPKLLLLDEPFLGLAPVWIRQIAEAIGQLRARGTTVLMTEQMARPALKLATSGYVMRGGEVRRGGPVDVIRDLALADEYL
ncbi:ABC transporter ATP-binding protein [Rhodopila sp.]|jgi:branched-chain amino acid transport system ATP-binding protein|uniref:ABC transporter ATP-binding protein n=1 Tax=Rhodopila sp. TaxID=2480087 RepID=UPI002BF88488|nr:ABC transporter ATP-binding protein [Rhodopila sp.]HVZ09897.1 ABC transporter ATP-binding protein [Rhodopila sp.]